MQDTASLGRQVKHATIFFCIKLVTNCLIRAIIKMIKIDNIFAQLEHGNYRLGVFTYYVISRGGGVSKIIPKLTIFNLNSTQRHSDIRLTIQ